MSVTQVSTGVIADSSVTQAKLASGVDGNGPAFSATLTSAQTVTSNALTKLAFATEEFDTASCYDNATNYRFTPNVAGYYQINLAAAMNTNVTQCNVVIYKNGNPVKGSYNIASSATTVAAFTSVLVSMNGSTDYIEGFVYTLGTTPQVATGAYTYFQGFMVRAA